MSDNVLSPDSESETGSEADRLSVNRRAETSELLDLVFDLLGNARRRYLIYHLITSDEDVAELSAVVDAVHEMEAARRATDMADTLSRKGVRLTLRHEHLPGLANAGVVEWDHGRQTVRLTNDSGFLDWAERACAVECQ